MSKPKQAAKANKGEDVMDLQMKDSNREAFEAWFESRYDAHFMQFALDLDMYVDKHTQASWEAWQAAKAQAAPWWISVEDQLPDGGQTVVAIGFDWGNKANKRHFVICEYFDGIWVGDQDEEFEYLTHWMPLPDAPQESAND